MIIPPSHFSLRIDSNTEVAGVSNLKSLDHFKIPLCAKDAF